MERTGGRPQNMLTEGQEGAAVSRHLRSHGQQIVETGWAQIVQLRGTHGEYNIVRAVEFILFDTAAAQPLRARALHELEVVGVVHHATAVGILIIDAYRPDK